METSDHLDRIFKLGFWITIDWNEQFCIFYNASGEVSSVEHDFLILKCCYQKVNNGYTFEEMIESCCDYFYHWYNRNSHKIIEYYDNLSYDVDKIDYDFILGDITKKVARDLNLSDLLEIGSKKK